jgi:Microfibril-associated/Pre-mRNA processing
VSYGSVPVAQSCNVYVIRFKINVLTKFRGLSVKKLYPSLCVLIQVKNFGRSGRTKYTHLVDQDTTQFDAPWADNSALNIKFHAAISAGMKQSFERPSVKKRK